MLGGGPQGALFGPPCWLSSPGSCCWNWVLWSTGAAAQGLPHPGICHQADAAGRKRQTVSPSASASALPVSPVTHTPQLAQFCPHHTFPHRAPKVFNLRPHKEMEKVTFWSTGRCVSSQAAKRWILNQTPESKVHNSTTQWLYDLEKLPNLSGPPHFHV